MNSRPGPRDGLRICESNLHILAFGAAIVTHLVLHWKWIVSVTRRFLGSVTLKTRLNYVLNTLFFVDMTLIVFTGVMISREALPLLGIALAAEGPWRALHALTADLAVVFLGLHVALHWKWIVAAALIVVGATAALASAGAFGQGLPDRGRGGRPERVFGVDADRPAVEAGARPEFDRGGHEFGGGSGWMTWVKNLGLIGLIVAAVMAIDRLRVRRRRPAGERGGGSVVR